MGFLRKFNRARKKEEQKQSKEVEEKAEEFIKEYKELSEKFGFEIVPKYEYTPSGINVILRVREIDKSVYRKDENNSN